MKAWHQEIESNWAGRSTLKKRIGRLIAAFEQGKVKSLSLQDYGRPRSLALPPEQMMSLTDMTALRQDNQQLRQENTSLNARITEQEEEKRQLIQEQDQELALERQQNATLRAEKQEIKARCDSLESKLDQVSQYVSLLMAERADRQVSSTIISESKRPGNSPGFFSQS